MKKLQKLATATGTALSTLSLTAGTVFAQDVGTVEVPTKGYATDIGSLVSGALTMVMVLAALLVLGYLIMGGVEWITSGGDKGKTESARNKITAAIIGLVILAASFAILQLALNFLGFEDLNDALSGMKNIRNE